MNARPVLLGLAGLFALPVVAFGAFTAFVFATEHNPAPVEAVPTQCSGAPPTLQPGQDLTVLSWNLQYGASRKHHFFYDGGDAVWVPPADVAETVAAISGVIEAVDADINLLQEIDRDSDRTGRKDQLPAYIEAGATPCASATPYHLARFVPKPLSRPLGRVDMELGVLSRVAHGGAQRHALALMDEPRVVQALNLKRALLTAELPIAGGGPPLAVAVTHLSAFSFGDGTLGMQVDALVEWMASRPPDQPWILAGDLNLLPPGDDPKRLAVEGELYADDPNPAGKLLPRFNEIFPDQLDPNIRTYLPFGAKEADRKIDYVFYGGPITLEEAAVLREHSAISDHLPIRARFRLSGVPAGEALPADEGGAGAGAAAGGAATDGAPGEGPPREAGP